MQKAFFVVIISAQLLAAQSLGVGIMGGWIQNRSTVNFVYHYDQFYPLENSLSVKHLVTNGPAVGLVLRLNSKSDRIGLNTEVQYSRLHGKKDSLRISPPPYI